MMFKGSKCCKEEQEKKLHLLVFQKAHRKTLIYLSCLLLESPPNGTFAGLSEKLHWLLKHLTMLEKNRKMSHWNFLAQNYILCGLLSNI